MVFNPVLMVNQLPRLKTSTEVLCHYKAVFQNIAIFMYHRVKEILGGEPNMNIPTLIPTSTSFPVVMVYSAIALAYFGSSFN